MADYGLNGKLKKIFDFLSAVNQTAYRDIYLLSNEILSKNPFTNNFLDRFLKGESPKHVSKFYIFLKTLKYYRNSFAHFAVYLLNFLAFCMSRLRYAENSHYKELILIDTFFLIDKIEKAGTYEDPYFVGLREVLDKLGKHYAYLPVFYWTKNPLRLLKILRLLKKERVPVLTEYQLLSVFDLFIIFFFILMYPIKVLRLAKILRDDTNKASVNKLNAENSVSNASVYSVDEGDAGFREAHLLGDELIANLPHVAFHRFSRYLQGKKIAALACGKIKLVSWFENQTIDKNLYKGLRKGGDKVRIYGMQPFIFSKMILNILVDENETRFGVVPDKIIVNSPYYIPDSTNLNFEVGPSFRYRKMFATVFSEKERSGILVLLPYITSDIKNILQVLNGVNFSERNVIIKTHPAVSIQLFSELLPKNSIITEADIYDLFKTAKIVIGAASGGLIEAASLGIPVISVKNTARLDYNPLPEYGKWVIWEEITNALELEGALRKFEDTLRAENRENAIKKIAENYKKMFFCKPDEKNIIKAFDLDN